MKFLQAHCPITFISVLGWEVWDLRGIIWAFKCDGSTEKRRLCLGKKNKLIGRSLIGKVKAFLSCIYFRKIIFSSFFFPFFVFFVLGTDTLEINACKTLYKPKNIYSLFP